MRLISQDGKVDVPYENSAVDVLANYGYSKEKNFSHTIGYRILAHIGDDCWDLGDYSTEEKALKVMEMLQQQYMRYITTVLIDTKAESTYFKFPPDESVNDVFYTEIDYQSSEMVYKLTKMAKTLGEQVT